MLAITGTLFCGLAVIAVALEATGPAIVLGGIAGVDDHAHSVKGCTISNGSPLVHRAPSRARWRARLQSINLKPAAAAEVTAAACGKSWGPKIFVELHQEFSPRLTSVPSGDPLGSKEPPFGVWR